MNNQLQVNLSEIVAFAEKHAEENIAFIQFLKQLNTETLDAIVHTLNEQIAPKIDCTICGNCCKSLMINVTEKEADALSNHLELSREKFDKQYLEKGSSGMMLINTIPCHFLEENKCTVYEYRFEGCKEFPAMHLPHFQQRLFTVFMHYDRCPIIFNVVEELKVETKFMRNYEL
ncbi:MAG: YkgJ family cysteine cluster protein [Chitinophagaceae bacterium]|nr:YkgJ family cysteine cluster protein [Chitinophagaceae bacterium]MCW5905288.1 YkgJ family cysteine cluster protein [Chitinophagaceae bacterium]